MTTGITVTDWSDLAGLPDDMEELSCQLRSLTRYARRWVCQRAGFEPSPLCLLGPLAELMDVLDGCFADLQALGLADWAELTAGAAAATADMKAADEWTADRMPVVA